MSTATGTNITRDGLVFSWDANNHKSLQLVGGNSVGLNAFKDLINGNSLSSTSGLYHIGKTFYNCFGITYPESSYAPVSRQGITPGFNATSGTKTYDMSRDLGFFAFDEDTNTWIPDSYFNGERINGHCYDTYDGAPSQHATFQADFDNIQSIYPNATFIFIGSHAAENVDNDIGTFNRLKTCGLPDSQLGLGRNEFVLVGKPNRSSTWNFVRNNYSAQVAQMNIGLPLDYIGNRGVYFNGSNYFDIPSIPFPNGQTVEIWLKPNEADSARRNPYNQAYGGYGTWTHEPSGIFNLYYGDGAGNASPYIGHGSSFTVGNGELACVCSTRGTSNSWWYKNGVKYNSYSHSFGSLTDHNTTIRIGSGYAGGYIGEIMSVKLYNRQLSDAEVQQNFNALRGRYGL